LDAGFRLLDNADVGYRRIPTLPKHTQLRFRKHAELVTCCYVLKALIATNFLFASTLPAWKVEQVERKDAKELITIPKM